MNDKTENETLLIVDDDSDLCFLMNRKFKERFNTIVAHSIKEATSVLENKLPDLILLDYNLPDGYGTNFLVKIRLNHISLPVIMLTGEFTEEVNKKAKVGGVKAFIQKPFDLLNLENLITEILQKNKVNKMQASEIL